MIEKRDVEGKEFPMKPQCSLAVKVGNEWHTCNKPIGHDGKHECKHYEWNDDETMFDKPMEKAQQVRFVRK